jgi:Na+/H+-dicarboxylate symporter
MHDYSGWTPFPLYAQVLIAVLFGATLGVLFGQEPYLVGLRNEQLGQLGQWVVWLLKTLAVPLIFVAILDSVLRASIPLHQGVKLLTICLINVSMAMLIGLAIMNVWQPGKAWQGHVEDLLQVVPGTNLTPTFTPSDHPLQDLLAYIPRTLADPLAGHNIIGVVLLALGLGLALRWTRSKSGSTHAVIDRVAWAIESAYGWLVTILWWVILVVPFAVFGVVASVVGRSGIEVFSVLWVFLAAMLLGLAVHALPGWSERNRRRCISDREPMPSRRPCRATVVWLPCRLRSVVSSACKSRHNRLGLPLVLGRI